MPQEEENMELLNIDAKATMKDDNSAISILKTLSRCSYSMERFRNKNSMSPETAFVIPITESENCTLHGQGRLVTTPDNTQQAEHKQVEGLDGSKQDQCESCKSKLRILSEKYKNELVALEERCRKIKERFGTKIQNITTENTKLKKDLEAINNVSIKNYIETKATQQAETILTLEEKFKIQEQNMKTALTKINDEMKPLQSKEEKHSDILIKIYNAMLEFHPRKPFLTKTHISSFDKQKPTMSMNNFEKYSVGKKRLLLPEPSEENRSKKKRIENCQEMSSKHDVKKQFGIISQISIQQQSNDDADTFLHSTDSKILQCLYVEGLRFNEIVYKRLQEIAKGSFYLFVKAALYSIVGVDVLVYCSANGLLKGSKRPAIPNFIINSIKHIYNEINSAKLNNNFNTIIDMIIDKLRMAKHIPIFVRSKQAKNITEKLNNITEVTKVNEM